MTQPLCIQVREVRKLRGMTQAALAAKVGVTRTAIVNIELENSNPSIKVLGKIADALGCDLEIELRIKK